MSLSNTATPIYYGQFKNYYKINYSKDYLEHYGVRGMKWGVRRYQNYDGTRTVAGEKRYRERNGSKNNINLKKAAIVGASLVAAGLIAYSGVKIANNPSFNKIMRKGLDALQGIPNIEDVISNSGPEIINSHASKIVNIDAADIFNKNTSENNKTLSDFKFVRVNRMDSNGNISSIDLPEDREGYADAFARNMSKTSGDYDYWKKYIISRMNYQ